MSVPSHARDRAAEVTWAQHDVSTDNHANMTLIYTWQGRTLIESNLATCGVQDQIFILRVLFGLVMTQLSRADDDAAESMLAIE
jgi:hypothetical protein